ncbi:IS3 family transposase [Streptomyces sp. NBC_01485]|uniref:IS3 family transposase n=1 Tax=Streptomyces sp. NBC_01485 TaxID=2903884 RepID=UPI002E31E4EB|nr:IS3 family transposase [Streptomyces sp. NBC_01485]
MKARFSEGIESWPPYYAHKQRQALPSARHIRDTELKILVKEAYDANYRVYDARKVWRELNRQGHAVARCTIERLMRELGLTGAVRGNRVITTVADPSAERAPDLVDRKFVADAPNRTWVADFTHVAAWAGTSSPPSSSTPSPAESSAGPPPPPNTPNSCSPHWRWACGNATAPAPRMAPKALIPPLAPVVGYQAPRTADGRAGNSSPGRYGAHADAQPPPPGPGTRSASPCRR